MHITNSFKKLKKLVKNSNELVKNATKKTLRSMKMKGGYINKTSKTLKKSMHYNSKKSSKKTLHRSKKTA
jgi:hypothetical protein